MFIELRLEGGLEIANETLESIKSYKGGFIPWMLCNI